MAVNFAPDEGADEGAEERAGLLWRALQAGQRSVSLLRPRGRETRTRFFSSVSPRRFPSPPLSSLSVLRGMEPRYLPPAVVFSRLQTWENESPYPIHPFTPSPLIQKIGWRFTGLVCCLKALP